MYTGVDYSGVLLVRDNNKYKGLHMPIHPCHYQSIRAVHLEIVPGMSSEAFLQAFRLFFCIRNSVPQVMISDHASTFTSASRQLHVLFLSTTIQGELNNRSIEWKLVPKRAPWFGGLWEREIDLTNTVV